MNKRLISMVMALTFALTCSAAGAETIKHERVYVVAGADGNIESLTDNIRLENADKLEEITDATKLTDIENVSGHETFTLDGETLIWQANGNDITYQGTSEEKIAAVPVVKIMLDGAEVTAEELSRKSGHAEIEVSFDTDGETPCVAVVALPLGDGISDVSVENGKVITESGSQVLVGFAVAGVDEKVEMPTVIRAEFEAENADLDWMMTFVTSEPMSAAMDLVKEKLDIEDEFQLDDIRTLLTALRDGTEAPEMEGEAGEIVTKLTEIKTGIGDLNDVAQSLADGAASAKDGADSLSSGLSQITANNDALNQGASAIFDAILSTANEQLASAGLEALGIEVPTLTAENYSETMDALIAATDPETVKASLRPQVEGVVRPQVEARRSEVEAAVTEAVKAQVLEAVLQGAGLDLTAEQYVAAVSAGQVTAEQAQQIEAAVTAQVADESVQAQITAATDEQIEQLVSENTDAAMEENETVTEAVARVTTASEALKALKDQLDQVNTFVTGVSDYTAGVTQAAEGAVTLASGLGDLSDGAKKLHDEGTQTLSDTLETEIKEKAGEALEWLDGDVKEWTDLIENTEDAVENAKGYDLIADGMSGQTVYIIRTDLK